jgi:hypothetical protein
MAPLVIRNQSQRHRHDVFDFCIREPLGWWRHGAWYTFGAFSARVAVFAPRIF